MDKEADHVRMCTKTCILIQTQPQKSFLEDIIYCNFKTYHFLNKH